MKLISELIHHSFPCMITKMHIFCDPFLLSNASTWLLQPICIVKILDKSLRPHFHNLFHRTNARINQPQQSSIHSTNPAFTSEDPFVILESTSTPAYASSKLFSDPLEEISKLSKSGGTKLGVSSNAIPSLRPPPKPMQVSKADKGSYCFLKLIKFSFP